jgi:hypothetical protein
VPASIAAAGATSGHAVDSVVGADSVRYGAATEKVTGALLAVPAAPGALAAWTV